MSYAYPHGQQITLTVSAFGYADAPRAMIVNPGGPGYPGIGAEQYVWSQLPEKVADQDEVFSFDPRGVGASSPISCGDLTKEAPLKPIPYRPKNAGDIRARLAQAKKIAQSCAAHVSRAMLRSMNVATEARDMDRVRQAIGASTVDYLGYSGGTDLGATYETLFPTRVGRVVLDGVIDPTVSEYISNREQDDGFQRRAEQFFSWVARRNTTYHQGSTRSAVERSWAAVRAKLDAHPAAGHVGSADLDYLLAIGMYLAYDWDQTAQYVTDYRNGDSANLVSAADHSAGGDIGLLAYTCSDPGWPKRWSTWHRDTTAADTVDPLFAWLNTWSSAPCLYWPVHRTTEPRIGSVTFPPTLLLETKDDPATPLIGAQRMRTALANSRLIVAGGGDHAAYLTDPNTCLDTKTERYWLTGALPADGTCPISEGDQ